MFWLPVAGQPGANGAPMGSYPMQMMAPGMTPAQPGVATSLPAGTPPSFPLAAVATPTAQLSSAVPGSNTVSGDFSVTGPNTAVSTPSQKAINTPSGGVPLSTSVSGSMPGTAATTATAAGMDPRQVYMMGAPGMPLGYAPMIAPGYVPVGAMPMMPAAGGYYPMAVYPTMPPTAASSGDFSKAVSGTYFMSAPAVSLSNTSGCFSAQASGDFTSAASFGSGPHTFSGTFGPQTSSGGFRNDSSSGQFRSSLSRSGKTGDAGRGYEAGVYYEGRVKRFNPVRGYGFLSATHKLLRLKDVKAGRVGKAASASVSVTGNDTAALKEAQDSTRVEPASKEKSTTTAEGNNHSTSSVLSENNRANGTNPKTSTAAAGNDAAGADVPLITVISATGTETDPDVNLGDIVVIKGEEYVRKPVVMGDIFVHYHCLQRTPEELESEQSGALVNLPAGARVQFKAEVFVPAKLMEEAKDSKQAAAMLNNIGIPVEEDPNLLAGAIATKKGWGYQAMNVVQLPSLPNQGTRRGRRGKARSVGNASTASMSSVNSARLSSTTSHGRSEHEENSNALAPCSGQSLKIHVDVENAQPPPPSFESATAGLTYAVPPAGGMVYYPAYPPMMPRQP